MSQELYYHIEKLPDLPEKYIQEAKAAQYDFKTSNWHEDSNAWRAMSSFEETGFMKALKRRYGDNKVKPNAIYLKNAPMEGYAWHKDRIRTCVINVVLTHNDPAYCIWREKKNNFFFDIMGPIPYIVGRPFLFNPTVEHMVFNLSQQERLIMSIGFFGPSYDEVKDFILNVMTPLDENYNFPVG